MNCTQLRKLTTACFLLSAIVICNGCSGKRTAEKVKSDSPVSAIDNSYLFDGSTLNGWEVTNFGTEGPVSVSNGEIILGMGDGCTGITYKKQVPEINYEVSLEAMRVTGTDFFCGLTFPVGKDPCTLIIGGWGGTVVGLSSIDGRDASENETTKYMKFQNNKWYRIILRVTENKIEALIDDELVVDFKINGKRLSVRPEVELSKPFGIASWCTTAALRNIRIKTSDIN